ncbi:hypothetical protein OIV83_002205 [Microbotryomycetes sp. JL201]|nr:hypothetical protein OIV83_002205 [Microbotryomycetes sp. JL201]
MSRICAKRLTKELLELKTNGPPTGCELIEANDLSQWIISLKVLGESLYQDEEFALRFKFSSSYPIDLLSSSIRARAGRVLCILTFTRTGISARGRLATMKASALWIVLTLLHRGMTLIRHSVLGNGWSPVLNVSALLLTFQSMLASCKEKKLPPDDAKYVRSAPSSAKQTRFVYHDDDV